MKKITQSLLLGGLIAATPMAYAGVDLGNGFEASANVGFVTNYSFRGQSQTTSNGPAVQGGFDLNHKSGFYAGIWGSNVGFGGSLEVDYYLGFSGMFANKLGYDVGYIYYNYPKDNSNPDLDYQEIYGSLSYDFGPASVSAGINYSDDYFGGSGTGTYYYGEVGIPLPADFSVTLHAGHQNIKDNATFGTPDYTDYSVALSKSLKGFDFGLTYKDTDLKRSECFGGTDACEGGFIFSVSRSF